MRQNPEVDLPLQPYQKVLDGDYERYRNHANRVFGLCVEMDASPENREKYAIAAAFHDLGIWTNRTFDYLAPSIALAVEYLKANGKDHWAEEISCIINYHHKISRYTGPFESTAETFRHADWADVTLGLIRFKIPRAHYRKAKREFPNRGFHRFLMRQVFKRFFTHPFSPLPMFKR